MPLPKSPASKTDTDEATVFGSELLRRKRTWFGLRDEKAIGEARAEIDTSQTIGNVVVAARRVGSSKRNEFNGRTSGFSCS